MTDPLAFVQFSDGKLRPVFELQDKQYVEGDDGEPIFGVWYIPPEECFRIDVPVIVECTISSNVTRVRGLDREYTQTSAAGQAVQSESLATPDELRDALHAAGWSLGEFATVAGHHVEGRNGENKIWAIADAPVEAWQELADAARSLGMPSERSGVKSATSGSP